MVYRGLIQHGMVILDDAIGLPDGTRVSVHVDDQTAALSIPGDPAPGSAEAVLAADVGWVGDLAELDTLVAEVQQMREEDLELQRRQEE